MLFRSPFTELDVRGEYDAPSFVAARDDLVEQARPVDVEGYVAELVQYDQVSTADVPEHRLERALTCVVGYGAAKAAISNLTKYLAGELAIKFGEGLRVNAIAPGFFLTEQNRTLMTNPDGSYTPRAESVIAHTPFRRLGTPDELFGTIQYLISDASKFVTGTIAIVDGGFDAFSI